MLSFRVRAAIATCLVIFFTALSWNFLLDDALIYYRYMRNALTGNGLVFNPGEHVNALTSPLATYFLLVASWVFHGHIHLAASSIFVLTFAGACILAERMVPLSGIFMASMSYFYSLVGMETSVLLLLVMAVVWLYQEELWNWLAVVLVLLALTRAEAGAFLLVFAFSMYRRDKRPNMVVYGAIACILCLYLLANRFLFHGLVPQSSAAKIGQGLSGYWGKWPRAFLHVGSIRNYSRGALTLPFIAIVGTIGIVRLRMPWGKPLLTAAGIMLSFYVLLNLPYYHWYYAPFLLTLVLYSVAWTNRHRSLQIVTLLLIVSQAVAAFFFLRRPEPRIADYRGIAEWLDTHARPNDTIEACEIGELGWATPRRVIDILGLTEPKNAMHVAHRDLTSWVEEDKPDYILVHREPFIFERAALSDPHYEHAGVSIGDVYLLRRVGVRPRDDVR